MDINSIKRYAKTDAGKEYVGQGIAALGRAIATPFQTPLGEKLMFGIGGLVGNLINEKTKKSDLARTILTHWMFAALGDWKASTVNAMSGDSMRMKSGISSRNFGSAFGALWEEPHIAMSALKAPSLGGLSSKFATLKGKLGALGRRTIGEGGSAMAPKISITKPIDARTYAMRDDIRDY